MRFVQLLLMLSPSVAFATGLPDITPAGGNGAASSPTTMVTTSVVQVINTIVLVVIAFLFITVIKNAWQKYHQLGEAGTKATWRDVGVNVIVGAVLAAIGIAYGIYAINIF